MAVGDYERIKTAQRMAWRVMRSASDPTERHLQEQRLAELRKRGEQYLRDLLAQLPFSWHIEHAYTPRETATYGGADHIVLDQEIKIGRLVRHAGDALSRARQKFWGLQAVKDNRLPNSIADIRVAERLVDR